MTVFDSGIRELSVPVTTPLALVGPTGCVRVLPIPVAESVTVAPLIGLPFASLAVTVIVDVSGPTAIEAGAAVSVDVVAETGPAVTLTVAVWVIVVPFAVAETVFDPAAVELSIPVTTPLSSLGPLGCTIVLPLPVADSATVAPLIGLPLASRTVTVIVALPPPAATDAGSAATVDCDAETGAELTVTVAVCVIAAPSIVAETVFTPPAVELRLPVATPLALVVAVGCVSVLPVPEAASTTVAPLIGLPLASFAVTVMVELPAPAINEVGAALTVETEAERGPGLTVTDAVCVSGTPRAVAETVFVPDPVELNVPVATPSAPVVPVGCVSVLPLPVAESTTVTPLIGLPLPSFTATVMVELPVPAVSEVGAAASVDNVGDTAGPVGAP